MSDEPQTELGVARAIAAGELPSGTEWQNSRFYRVRISGVGVAWRSKNREFTYRSPDEWLSDEMCRRSCGLFLVEAHPDKQILDGQSFYDSIVGVVIHAFVDHEKQELAGIARIIDPRACEILDSEQWDTSPSVTLDGAQSIVLQVDGSPLILEPPPLLLDHLALIAPPGKGVWSRDQDSVGIETQASAS